MHDYTAIKRGNSLNVPTLLRSVADCMLQPAYIGDVMAIALRSQFGPELSRTSVFSREHVKEPLTVPIIRDGLHRQFPLTDEFIHSHTS